MDNTSMCRICLVEDIRMYGLHNTYLQETYERLTGLPFVTKDSRPLQVCYICCARLQNCYKLQTTCLQSEEIFMEMLENNQLELMIKENAMVLSVDPVSNWSNVAISPEDVPVDIIIDDNDDSDDDDDVIFCDNNHNLDVKVDVKVEAVEDNIEHIALKNTAPNDKSVVLKQSVNTKTIGSNTTEFVNSTVDNIPGDSTRNTESNNSFRPHVSSVKHSIKQKTNTTKHLILDNKPRFKRTAKNNVTKLTNNKKRIVSYDSPRLDICIVKGDIVQEAVDIDYTEDIDCPEVADTITSVENAAPTKEVSSLEDNTIGCEFTLHTHANRSDTNNIEEDIVKHAEPNITPILDVNIVTADTAIQLPSSEHAGSRKEVSSLEQDIVEQEFSSDPNQSNINNTEQVIEIKHADPNITPILDVNMVTGDTAIQLASGEHAGSRKEVSSIEQNTVEHEFTVHSDPNQSDKNNTEQVIEIKHADPNITPILDVNMVKGDTAIQLASEHAVYRKEVSSLQQSTIEYKISTAHTDQNRSDTNNIEQAIVKHAEAKINPILDINIVTADTAIQLPSSEHAGSRKEVSSLEQDIVEQEFSSDPNQSNINNTEQVIEIKHADPNITPILDVNMVTGDTAIQLAGGEHAGSRKEVSSIEQNTVEHEFTVHSDPNQSHKNNTEQVIAIKHAEPNITPILDVNIVTADTAIKLASSEHVGYTEENNSLEEKTVEHEFTMHTDQNASVKNNIEEIVIKHAEPNIPPTLDVNIVTPDTAIKLASSEHAGYTKGSSSFVQHTAEHEICTVHTDINHSGKNNTEQVIGIKQAERNISSIPDIDLVTADTLLQLASGTHARFRKEDSSSLHDTIEHEISTTRIDLNRIIKHTELNTTPILDINAVTPDTNIQLSSSKHLTSTKEVRSLDKNEVEHKISTLHTDQKRSGKNNTEQVIKIKHVETDITPILDVNVVTADTLLRLATGENARSRKEIRSLKENSLENQTITVHTDSNSKNNIKVIAIKHAESIDETELNICTLQDNINNQKTVINESKSNDTSKFNDINSVDHIISQEVVIEYTESEESRSDRDAVDDINHSLNEYDIFRCDDINAVEGNFIGQEVIIDYIETTDVPTFDNVLDNNIINQNDSSKTKVNNIANLDDTSKDTIMNQDVSTESTKHSTHIYDDVEPIEHNITAQEVVIEYTETKDIPKLDEDSLKNNGKKEINIEFTELNDVDNTENCDQKGNLSVDNIEMEIEDEIEEKYNIESEFSGTTTTATDDVDKEKCVESDATNGVFRKDVMVVLHKMELDGRKTNEDLNFEAENKVIRTKDNWRRRSNRKRKSAVLKETPQTGNTRKQNKKVRFSHIIDNEDKNLKDVDEKPFICDICHKSFILKHHLIEHNRKHTGEKPYKCDICEQRFYYQNVLNNHVASHSDSRPHKCNICGKCYGLKVNLMRHIRVHTCEKPYKCNICGKSFGYKQHLTTHIRIHTGERPFSCHLCPKRFNQRNNLNTHLRSMHPDLIPLS